MPTPCLTRSKRLPNGAWPLPRSSAATPPLGAEKAQRIPNLTVSLGSQYSREDRERVNVVGLSMPLPLFDRNQGNVLAAARRADQARDLRNAVALRLRSETRSAISQWEAAMQDVEAYDRTILPAAQQP